MFKNRKATYTNQYIPSPRYQIEQELGEEYFPTIGEYFGVFGLIKVLLGKQLVKEKIEDDKMVRGVYFLCYNWWCVFFTHDAVVQTIGPASEYNHHHV